MKYYFWRFIHNVLVHPLIGISGWNSITEFLHEWTGEKWEKSQIQLRTVCGIIKNPDNYSQYLGVSRKDNHNDFGLVGGKVEESETPLEAIKRELEEETGLQVEIAQLVDVREWKNEIVYCYFIKTKGTLKTNEDLMRNGEGILQWITFDKLCEGSFGDYNKTVLSEYE